MEETKKIYPSRLAVGFLKENGLGTPKNNTLIYTFLIKQRKTKSVN
jgi:hypothetical protein